MQFDPDALLAALPKRTIRPVLLDLKHQPRKQSVPGVNSPAPLLGEKGEYNGFSAKERNRTADVSNWLVAQGSTTRAAVCDVCGQPAHDEHAENYFDLTSWIGLCQRCHRVALHNRFTKPERWLALLDANELPEAHWARLVAPRPFDLARLLRSRGLSEPTKGDFYH